MDESVSVFLGWTVLGFAALLGYATWKKVPGGALGLLKTAVQTGKIPNAPQGTPQDTNTGPNAQGGVGTATYGPPAGTNAVTQAAINFAQAQLGKPYVWGATGPDSFDCSGLVQAAYKAAGVTIGRTTYQQVFNGSKVPTTGPILAGDLVFPDAGHVMLALGNGTAIQSPHTGAVVDIVSIPSSLFAVRRVA